MIEVEGLLRFQPFHCCKTNHKIIVQPFKKCQQNHNTVLLQYLIAEKYLLMICYFDTLTV